MLVFSIWELLIPLLKTDDIPRRGKHYGFVFSMKMKLLVFGQKGAGISVKRERPPLIQEYKWLKQEATLPTLGLYLCRENSWVLLIRKTSQSWLTGTERAFVSPGRFCHSPVDNIKHCDRDKVHMIAVQTRGTFKHLIEFLSGIERFLKSNSLSS